MKITRKIAVMIVAVALSVVMSAPTQSVSACVGCTGGGVILSATTIVRK